MRLLEKPVANPSVVLREQSDQWGVLYTPDGGNVVGISPVGVAVWRRLDGTRTVEEIVAEVAQLFTEVPRTASEEVAGFLAELAEMGFVHFSPEGLGSGGAPLM